MSDIKSMLDSIIDGANNKFPNTVNSTLHQNMGVGTPQTFDAGKFREKLSLYVLHDIISAMMHDETKDLDGMIDQSIIKHIKDDYGCSCYGYLCKSRDKLNSPILSDVIQEIDGKTMQIQSKVVDKQDDSFTADAENLKDELEEIENYEELRKRLKEIVSNKVVNDVAKVVTQSNDAPVFDDLDNKLEEKKSEKVEDKTADGDETSEEISDETTNESVILRMTGKIVSEAAIAGTPISTEEGINRAIIEYCLCEMDYLFKMDPTGTNLGKFLDNPIQEGFFTTTEGHAFVRVDQQKAEQLEKNKGECASRVAKAVNDNYRRYGIDEAYAKAFARNSSSIKCRLSQEGSRYVLNITYPTDYVDSKDTTFISKIQRCIESEFR